MNSLMSWVGGKKALRKEVVRRFPLYCKRYIEIFGGSDRVLFHKNPDDDFEVYNDFSGLLTNPCHCVREKLGPLINSLRYVLNAREDFDRVRLALRRKRTTSVQRTARFYQIIRRSYASALTSFGSQPHDLWVNLPLIEQAHRRLTRVVIENESFEKLVRHYDRLESLFYCDPPCHYTEGYYSNTGENGFTEKNHIRLRDTLLPIQGEFLLSYNDDDFIREPYDTPGIQIEPVIRLSNIRQRYNPNCQFAGLLIASYDLRERERSSIQLNLFDFDMKGTDYEICKKNHFQRPPDPRGSHEAS